MRITVPATSANVRPGFGSVDVAVSKYLTIKILEPSEKQEVLRDLGDVSSDEANLLIATVSQVKAGLQPHRIKMVSDIPLAQGLGSSSSVIVAGIELANQLAHLQLSADEKLVIATGIEGHPDNVAPATFGNLVIPSYVDEKVNSAVAAFPEASFMAFIPNYELKTSDSRNVLSNELSCKKAVAASSTANVAIATLLTGDLGKAGKVTEISLFHERFRQELAKEFTPIKKAAHEIGTYATHLSGADPTVMTLAPRAKEAELVEHLEVLALDGEVVALYVNTRGISVEKD